MNKIILIFSFLLFSCSVVDLGYIDLFRESFKNNEIDDLDSFIETNYSFIRITKAKNQAVFILSTYEDGIETWVGASGEKIVTYKGLIIRTSGLDSNSDLYFPDRLRDHVFKSDFYSYLSFDHPKASYLEARFQMNHGLFKDYRINCNSNIKVISLEIRSIKYFEDLEFCFDESGILIESLQRFNQFDDALKIEYFYKY